MATFALPGYGSSTPHTGYPSLESIPRQPFYTELPGSASEARKRADGMFGTGATGKSMPVVSVGISMVKFMGDYSFVADPVDGQYVFHVKQAEQRGDDVAVISVASLNQVLKRGWEKGWNAITSTQKYTDAQRQALRRRPTRYWDTLNFVVEEVKTNTSDKDTDIAYLCPELFAPYFLPFGFLQGMGPEFQFTPQKTVRVSGAIKSVENIWGNNILTGDRLFLILKRVYNKSTSTWGHYCFVPWAGRMCDPSIGDVTYEDVSGFQRIARVYFIGKVITWMDHVEIRDDLLGSYLSIETGVKTDTQRVQPKCLWVDTSFRPRTKVPWLCY